MPDYVKTALTLLEKNSCRGYPAGGCVRDFLLGRAVHDYDIAVSCEPEKTREIFSDFRVIDTGILHGTVTVVIDAQPLELTSFRRDGEYLDLRRPSSVSFTADMHEDAARRDFTVNAMYYDMHAGIIDDFSGREDLKNKIIRCVGEPERRFNEDALRILRALRFASELDFSIEENTGRAALLLRDNLKMVSAERIFAEFRRLISGTAAKRVILAFKEIVFCVLPELSSAGAAEFTGALDAMSRCSDCAMRAAALFYPAGAAAEDMCRRLKTDKAFMRDVLFFISQRDRSINTAGELRRLAGDAGADRVQRLLSFRAAAGIENSPELLKTAALIDEKKLCTAAAELDINGRELEKIGFRGKAVGAALRTLLVEVTEGRLLNEKEQLVKFSRQIYNSLKVEN